MITYQIGVNGVATDNARWVGDSAYRRHVSQAEFAAWRSAGVPVYSVVIPADDPFWKLPVTIG